MARYGYVYGMARYGQVWLGMASYMAGLVWLGMARYG